jgi:trans-AT polyketide synthase/acyltransferase/oxidoreductase domain-containing protein
MMTPLVKACAALGTWTPGPEAPLFDEKSCQARLSRLHQSIAVIQREGRLGLACGGQARLGFDARDDRDTAETYELLAYAPALSPERLGSEAFRRDHGLRYAYVSGSMANGIASEALVEAMAGAGMLGFFGSAGLSPSRVEAALDRLQTNLEGQPFGFNLIHSPSEPELEAAIVELYLRRGLRLIEASAYMALTLPLVRFRTRGIHRDESGEIVTPNRVIGKVSRVEVARRFLSPPPAEMLAELVRRGELTQAQAELAAQIPMADDITAEADSGGHTDNRPAIALIPTMIALTRRIEAEQGYRRPLRVGAAGGIATPAAAAAAFAMGADYIVTGSVNQACVESGSSDIVRGMLKDAEQADVAMAPAADMFEMGVKLQVLKRGTMFPMRAAKLFELYRAYNSLEELPTKERENLEKQYFRTSLEASWESTKRYFMERDPSQVKRAEADPKHKMALVLRSYLGLSSRWANAGEASRRLDYQVWCGPAMGAFNEWAKGSQFDQVAERKAASVARNLLFGAALRLRWQNLRLQSADLPSSWLDDRPRTDQEIKERLAS